MTGCMRKCRPRITECAPGAIIQIVKIKDSMGVRIQRIVPPECVKTLTERNSSAVKILAWNSAGLTLKHKLLSTDGGDWSWIYKVQPSNGRDYTFVIDIDMTSAEQQIADQRLKRRPYAKEETESDVQLTNIGLNRHIGVPNLQMAIRDTATKHSV